MKRYDNRKAWPILGPNGEATEAALEFFVYWVSAFNRSRVSEQEADAASIRLGSGGGKVPWPGPDQLHAIMDIIGTIRAEIAPVVANTLESARHLSRGCPECGGEGWATRQAIRPGRSHKSNVSMFCMCPAGMFIARRMFDTDRKTYAQTRRLDKYPELWRPGLKYDRWPDQPSERTWELETWWVLPVAPLPEDGDGPERPWSKRLSAGVGNPADARPAEQAAF